MKRWLSLLLIAESAALAAPVPSPSLAGTDPVPFADVVNCLRAVTSKNLRAEAPFDGGHRFHFRSVRTGAVSDVDVFVFRDDDMPVRVRGAGNDWLGTDERLVSEVETCAREEVVVLRGRRRSGFDEGNRRHMPSAALRAQTQASSAPSY